jgi:hypothetical protein
MADPEHGFLARWSRRKQTARRERPGRGELDAPEAPEASEPAAPPDSATPESAEAAGDPELVARLPDPDSLDESSDFSVFLQEGVPDAIRRKALRRLWRLNPVFANLDGLNDYDEDFTDAATVIEGLKTLYKAGKGYLDEHESAAPEVEAAEAEAGEVPAAAEASQDRGGDSERVAEAERGAEPPREADSPAPGPALAAEEEIPKPVRGSARKRRWGAVDG